MKVKEKYLELCKKSVNRKNNGYLFTYLENRPKSCLRTVHCLKVEIINCRKMCRIFHETLQYAWEPRNGDCGRLGNLYAILLENNISTMSQLSLNLGYCGLLSFAFMLACPFFEMHCYFSLPIQFAIILVLSDEMCLMCSSLPFGVWFLKAWLALTQD